MREMEISRQSAGVIIDLFRAPLWVCLHPCTTIQTKEYQAACRPQLVLVRRGAVQSSWQPSTRSTAHPALQVCAAAESHKKHNHLDSCVASHDRARSVMPTVPYRSRETTQFRAGQNLQHSKSGKNSTSLDSACIQLVLSLLLFNLVSRVSLIKVFAISGDTFGK
jgi:hypothetical protein